ncbi:hypothetical protein FT663_04303 [Candidozyma haemuli var. vulneris]|uniref:Uncharacterized protein n=1 Tax=Candidozyma haemuli TaxID=45357 RepID=A0A2V1AP39_9ASCO|nr:hypothetical protein CXQ85_001307 [[Candida] haemuloni]KAF3986730.1 hypothetical protein FT662_04388 [[Candida] haemuloni var. vulneris]KAF3987783.1 hypothetical protein FT663_04303 [[Candida] haemuloni var. vulneris]PVH19013.1 hypothetical protein CXQ85_001307 [[Candida] haemuloni]
MTRIPMTLRFTSTTSPANVLNKTIKPQQRKRDRIFSRLNRVTNKVGTWIHKPYSKLKSSSSSSLDLAEKDASAPSTKVSKEPTTMHSLKQMKKFLFFKSSRLAESSDLTTTVKKLLEEQNCTIPVLLFKNYPSSDSPDKGFAFFAKMVRQTAKMSSKLLTETAVSTDGWQTVKPRRQKKKVERSSDPTPVLIPSTLKNMRKSQKITIGKSSEPVQDLSKLKRKNIYDHLSI